MEILRKPLTLALIATGLWLVLRWFGFDRFIAGDEGTVSGGTMAFVAVVYALYTGFIFLTVWGQWVAVEEAVRAGDRTKFVLHKDKRIPEPAKTLLLLFSLLVVGAAFLLYFRNPLPGAFTIFAVVIAVATYWEVVMDLDDPFTGVWNVQVPEAWRDAS